MYLHLTVGLCNNNFIIAMEEPGTSWNSWGEALKIWPYEVHDDVGDDDGGDRGDVLDSGNSVSLTTVVVYFIV